MQLKLINYMFKFLLKFKQNWFLTGHCSILVENLTFRLWLASCMLHMNDCLIELLIYQENLPINVVPSSMIYFEYNT